ncbi:hypothetical protein ElyMa_002913600 [Elysia marginata]|uniref:TNFR-Cys domain-containing protein n=1 Tax=Elysia marginata TaxID=1093978 RepID=A0AAV4I3A0_9GAST|nr:hypothetical protein ElyMa_002913600 [Elysia marginata]
MYLVPVKTPVTASIINDIPYSKESPPASPALLPESALYETCHGTAPPSGLHNFASPLDVEPPSPYSVPNPHSSSTRKRITSYTTSSAPLSDHIQYETIEDMVKIYMALSKSTSPRDIEHSGVYSRIRSDSSATTKPKMFDKVSAPPVSEHILYETIHDIVRANMAIDRSTSPRGTEHTDVYSRISSGSSSTRKPTTSCKASVAPLSEHIQYETIHDMVRAYTAISSSTSPRDTEHTNVYSRISSDSSSTRKPTTSYEASVALASENIQYETIHDMVRAYMALSNSTSQHDMGYSGVYSRISSNLSSTKKHTKFDKASADLPSAQIQYETVYEMTPPYLALYNSISLQDMEHPNAYSRIRSESDPSSTRKHITSNKALVDLSSDHIQQETIYENTPPYLALYNFTSPQDIEHPNVYSRTASDSSYIKKHTTMTTCDKASAGPPSDLIKYETVNDTIPPYLALYNYKVSVWAHVILPMCIAFVVFLLLIAFVIIWSRCKKKKYKRSKMEELLSEKEAVTHIEFPDDQYHSLDEPDVDCTKCSESGQRAEVTLVPRDPLVIDHERVRQERSSELGAADDVLTKLCARDTIDEGLGDDYTDAEQRSRSSGSLCTDCPPESLESPKIPYADSQHSLLQMEV